MSITRTKDGKYRVRVYRAKGKLIDRIVATEREAKQLEAELRMQVKKGEYVSPSRMTVEAFLYEWLEKSVKRTSKPRTYEAYEQTVRLHLVPVIGHLRLERLEPLHIEELLAAKYDEVSERTLLAIYARLHAALETAVRWRLVARNVCDAVEPPKPGEADMYVMSAEEARRLEEACKGVRLGPLVILALHTGMRLGELLGLQWSDIEGEELHVRRTLVKYGKEPVFGTPKNGKVRTVPLDDAAREALAARKVDQELERAFYGDGYRDLGLVFTQLNGGALDASSFRKQDWAKIRAKAGLSVRFHDLRHTFISRALAAGANPRAVSDIVGHSDPGFTLRRYAHALPDDRRAAVEKLSRYLRGGENSGDETG